MISGWKGGGFLKCPPVFIGSISHAGSLSGSTNENCCNIVPKNRNICMRAVCSPMHILLPVVKNMVFSVQCHDDLIVIILNLSLPYLMNLDKNY